MPVQAEVRRHHHRFQARPQVYPNLDRDMERTGIDQIWVAGTCIRPEEEFVHLSTVVLDAFSCRVITGPVRITAASWSWLATSRSKIGHDGEVHDGLFGH